MNSYEPERINVEELDSVAEGFNKTNRNNFNLKIFLNEWFNSIGEKLKNLGDSIQNIGISIQSLTKEVEKKANKTDIPTSLPANGGNANTLGGVAPGYHPTNEYIPIVGQQVMEIKKYIDFHEAGSNEDFDGRLFLDNKFPFWRPGGGNVSRIPLSDGGIQINLNAEMLSGKKLEYFANKEESLIEKAPGVKEMVNLKQGIYQIFDGNKMFTDFPKEAFNLQLHYGQVVVTQAAWYKQFRMILSDANLTTISEFIGFSVPDRPILWKKI